jgi:hypothetical protein
MDHQGAGRTSVQQVGQERDKIETRVNKGKEKKERSSPSELSPLFGGQEKKRAPAKPKPASVRDRLIEVASPEAVDSYLEFRKGGQGERHKRSSCFTASQANGRDMRGRMLRAPGRISHGCVAMSENGGWLLQRLVSFSTGRMDGHARPRMQRHCTACLTIRYRASRWAAGHRAILG